VRALGEDIQLEAKESGFLRNNPADTLTFWRLQASRTVRKYTSVVETTQSMVLCSGSQN
jgi:hypothetical protein